MAREGQNHPIDLNKMPSPSSETESARLPLEQSYNETGSVAAPEQVEKEVNKKRKRGPNRKFNFPPGLTRKEKRRAYRKASYAAMVS